MQSSSKLIDEAVEQMSSLPGVGKKTAMRLVLHLLNRSELEVEEFAKAFTAMRNNITFCKTCHNISEEEICTICRNSNRDTSTICVVENIRDVMIIENTHQYKGLYHVLGGVISPMDGIGPNDLHIDDLIKRAESSETKELIFALSTTMEGDTTNFYLYKRLKNADINITTLARGVAIGDELEYADEVTLGRSLVNRTPYESALNTQ